MTALLRCAALFVLVCAPALASAAPEQSAAQALPKKQAATMARPQAARKSQAPPVTVVLPEAALYQALSGILPLPIEHDGGKQFQGIVTLDSIDSLSIGSGRIRISGQLSGRNMTMNANVGNQDIQVKLGSLVLPVICDVDLRFNSAQQLLLLTPRFQRANLGSNDSDEALLALLNSLSKEYEVPLHNVMPLSGQIGSSKVQLRMLPLDIRAEDGAVTLRMRPVTKKHP